MAVSLVIYEDNVRLRESLELLLHGESGFSVVGSFSNCDHVIHDMVEIAPELVIMDIDMPGINGMEGVKRIKMTTAYLNVSAMGRMGIC